MKRILIFVILVCSAFGLISAQPSNWNSRQLRTQASRQDVQTGYRFEDDPFLQDTVYIIPGPARRIISGILGVSRGMITLVDRRGVAWYIVGLDRFVGFIDGLDLGQEVEVEGYAAVVPGSSQERFFQATKLILDGMDYDLTPFPGGSQVTVYPHNSPFPGSSRVTIHPRNEPVPETARPRREPVPERPRGREPRRASPWSPANSLDWMQDLDLNAIWEEKTPKIMWNN
ncbi:hypothetical protein FACS1894140_5810 [Spirochaetia bacterium]|nr:hypothetical protein FACS1894140_5810 [Spirochaetia bacterium]